jgi:hypothetical protein
MFKKILKGLGIAFLLLVILFVGIGVWTGYKSAAYKETAVPYIKIVVPEISKWDHALMKSYMSPETFEGVTDANFEKVVSYLGKMGALISMEEPVFQTVSSSATVQNGAATIVNYSVLAKYENGDANISISLKEVEDSFEVYKFNLNSMALAE